MWLLEKSKHNLTDSMMTDAENNLLSMKDQNQLEIAKVEQDIQLAKSEFVSKKEDQTVALVLQKKTFSSRNILSHCTKICMCSKRE